MKRTHTLNTNLHILHTQILKHRSSKYLETFTFSTDKYLRLQLWNTGCQGVHRPYTLNTECQIPGNKSLKNRLSISSETICTEHGFLLLPQTLVKDHQNVEKLLILNAYAKMPQQNLGKNTLKEFRDFSSECRPQKPSNSILEYMGAC